MLFAGVFIIIIASFVIAHWVAYFSLVKFFDVANLAVRNILLGSLIFLGASFILSMMLSHWRDNLFTRAYYLFSGVWVGLLINLLLFLVVGWLVVWLGKLGNVAIKGEIIGIIVVVFAIAYSVYGAWNAFNPFVKQIDVSIENLPKEWVGKKIVQLSDIHLGHVYQDQYMVKIAEKVNALKPDVIVITGDLFDGTDGKLDIFVKPLNMLSAPKGVFYVTGNHETYLGLEETFNILKKTKLIPLRDEVKNVDGLQFIGIDYPERMETKDVAQVIGKMENFDSTKPSVLLWHIPTQIAAIKKLGISLQLSGHTHEGQLFPFGIITHFLFKGYDYGLKKEGSFSIYTSSGLGGWGPPMRTQQRSEIVEITLH